MRVFNDLKTRGVDDILIAVTDGLKGMPEALAAVFPATTVQTCVVYLIRSSLDYASWKDCKVLASAIKPVYTASSAEGAEGELTAFEQSPLGQRFPIVVATWRRAWDRVIPFFVFPPAVRRVIHTTDEIDTRSERYFLGRWRGRPFPHRRGRDQAAVARAAQHHCRLGQSHPGLERSHEPIRHALYEHRFTRTHWQAAAKCLCGAVRRDRRL
jgi:hypothetical protein